MWSIPGRSGRRPQVGWGRFCRSTAVAALSPLLLAQVTHALLSVGVLNTSLHTFKAPRIVLWTRHVVNRLLHSVENPALKQGSNCFGTFKSFMSTFDAQALVVRGNQQTMYHDPAVLAAKAGIGRKGRSGIRPVCKRPAAFLYVPKTNPYSQPSLPPFLQPFFRSKV